MNPSDVMDILGDELSLKEKSVLAALVDEQHKKELGKRAEMIQDKEDENKKKEEKIKRLERSTS